MFFVTDENILEYDFWGLFFLSKVTPKSGHTHKFCVLKKIRKLFCLNPRGFHEEKRDQKKVPL